MKYTIQIFVMLMSLLFATSCFGHDGWSYTSDFTKCIDTCETAENLCQSKALSTVDWNDCWYADEICLTDCAFELVNETPNTIVKD
jgi:hypothetical protein